MFLMMLVLIRVLMYLLFRLLMFIVWCEVKWVMVFLCCVGQDSLFEQCYVVVFFLCMIFELYIGQCVGICQGVVFCGCWLRMMLIIFGIMLLVWCMIMLLLMCMLRCVIWLVLCSVVLDMIMLVMVIGVSCVIGVVVLVWFIWILIVFIVVFCFCVGNLCVMVQCGVCEMKFIVCWLVWLLSLQIMLLILNGRLLWCLLILWQQLSRLFVFFIILYSVLIGKFQVLSWVSVFEWVLGSLLFCILLVLQVKKFNLCCVLIFGLSWCSDLVVVLCGLVSILLLCRCVCLLQVLKLVWVMYILLCIFSMFGQFLLCRCLGMLLILCRLVVMFLLVLLLSWVVLSMK